MSDSPVNPHRGVKATMRRTWPVLLSYAMFSMWGVGCFTGALVFGTGGFGMSPNAYLAMAGVLAAVAIGHVLGNILGLAGFRLVPIIVLFFGMQFLVGLSGMALGLFAVFLWIAVFAAFGGYLGIASRLDVVASWYPMAFCSGGAIIWMNTHQKVAVWETGSKHGVWDAFTIVCLAGGVFWMLVFLATRNALGLTVWQEVARPQSGEQQRVHVARPGRGSILVLMAFTIVVLGGTALISPYLFRTGEPECKEENKDLCYKADSGQSDGKELKGKKTKSRGRSSSKPEPGEEKPDKDPTGDPDMSGAAEAAAEAAKIGIKILAYLLVAAAIFLFFYLVIFPPIRRRFLMRHLEKPLWPVAPTARVMNHWRRALAVLAIARIEPTAGETATDFATRAAKELKDSVGCDAPGLDDAAKIVERIAFAGRGLGSADEKTVGDAITAFVNHVQPRLKLKSRLAASWGRAPEVESS